MMDKLLESRLRPAARRHHRQALAWRLTACWSAGALAATGLILGQGALGWAPGFAAFALAALTGVTAGVLWVRHRSIAADYRAIAQKIEQRHPELNGLLLTAVQQPHPEGGPSNYFQQRLLDQALEHSRDHDWRALVPRSRVLLALAAQLAALGLFLAALVNLRTVEGRGGAARSAGEKLVVTPGDVSLERGESLVVLARFGGPLPAAVSLVIRSSGETAHRIALVKSLADPVFGGDIPEVDHDLTYRLEYTAGSTREFKVSVFEHPRLERADANLTFPAYTRLAPKRIENTRRVSGVEGTRLDLALQLNKPVASAALVAHDAKKTVIPLQVSADKAVATLPAFSLVASQTYDLKLVDRDGRGNLLATPFVIDVSPDRPPEWHVTSPRGDLRPSPIEEIDFAGTLLGDFGVSAYGLAYTLAGSGPKTIELGRSVPALEKRAFAYTLRLEDLGIQPDQLLSWYVWADDTGPDGKARRTTGDLYFAEIRPFDEIFRESKAMQAPDGEQGDSPGQGNESQRLAQLQKQIISATWKLQRNPSEPRYADDAKVVRDSQTQALTQAGQRRQQADEPRAQALWSAVTQEMRQAVAHLGRAGKSPDALTPALGAEQSAYQSLLRLQSRETQVARGRSGGGGSRGGASQSELDQLDLTQDQNRYETQRQAEQAQSPERREQLQVMNRLQELARRQQDVNDRLKEMQTALQEARTDQQREEIRRQLKRLEDEQQQVLADTDELRQRLDQQQDQSSMSEQRRQLEQTRDDVQRAAEATAQGAVPEALASGTRAQRQFQDMRDQLHKENSSQFSDELRAMRTQARELSQREEDLSPKLDPAATGSERKRLSDAPESGGPAAELDQQKKRMSDLVERAQQVSQQAENSEPLLAEKLFDSLRKLGQDDGGTVKEFQQELLNDGLLTRSLNDRLTDTAATPGTKSLDLASALVQEGYLPQAREAEERARAGINVLKDGIEGAAESVIGDDTAALELAQSELDTVTDQLKREMAQAPAPGPAAGSPEELAQVEEAVRAQPNSAQARNNLADALARLGRMAEAKAQRDRARQIASAGAPPGQAGQGAAAASAGAAAAGGEKSPAPADASALLERLKQRRQQQLLSEGRAEAGSAPAPAGNLQGQGGGGGGAQDLENLLNGRARGGISGGAAPGAPITGTGYGSWSDRLRDVEEIVDAPDLRNAVAGARERARLLRQAFTRDRQRPDWAVVQREVVQPLVEVRNQISDELARRGSKESLAPIDRDPVPIRYAESVRKYYEALGKDK